MREDSFVTQTNPQSALAHLGFLQVHTDLLFATKFSTAKIYLIEGHRAPTWETLNTPVSTQRSPPFRWNVAAVSPVLG
jgi:hypothetical protein